MKKELAGFPYFEIEFDRDACPVDAESAGALTGWLATAEVTDLLVLSHGWNNHKVEARDLYARLACRLREGFGTSDLGAAEEPGSRVYAVAGVLWPSKKFADRELIPGGAATYGGEEDELAQRLEELKGFFDGGDGPLETAKAQLPLLEDRASAQREVADALRRLLGDPARLDAESRGEIPAPFFELDGAALLEEMGWPDFPTPDDLEEAPSFLEGEAAGLGDSLDDVWAGAKNLLNYLTYYQMKKRALEVGMGGLYDVLAQVSRARPSVRLHFIGHSFGARLLTGTATGPAGAEPLGVQSLVLLQAAFSHYGFAERFDGVRDGLFRRMVTERRVAGPVVISHTVNDRAVGLAYPLASRLARQRAAALGDAGDPFGGLGRNGARKTPEAEDRRMLRVGERYAFKGGVLYNLLADDVIQGHSDLDHPEVAHAILSAVSVG